MSSYSDHIVKVARTIGEDARDTHPHRSVLRDLPCWARVVMYTPTGSSEAVKMLRPPAKTNKPETWTTMIKAGSGRGVGLCLGWSGEDRDPGLLWFLYERRSTRFRRPVLSATIDRLTATRTWSAT